MNSECNNLREMLNRLLFLLYIAAYVTYLIMCVVALARPDVKGIATAVGNLLLLVALRWSGYRWFDFPRLCESFPSGCSLDLVPDAIRREVEQLIGEFQDSCSDWVRRADIRHRLVELEEENPEIIEAFEDELKIVLGC